MNMDDLNMELLQEDIDTDCDPLAPTPEEAREAALRQLNEDNRKKRGEGGSSRNSKRPKDAQERLEYWERRGLRPPISIGAFMNTKYSVQFLVDRCLAKGAPCTVAGASKGMKTTVSINLGLALASGGLFLGKFHAQKCRTLFASAESGESVLQRNMRGMAEAMEINIDELEKDGSLAVQFWVPRISNDDMMDFFADCLDASQPEVVIIDPLYLALDGDHQANLSLNGEQIQKLVRLILDRGATPVVDDHVKRSSENAKSFKALQLEDITGAAKSEFFRQWMLLGRRSKFDDLGESPSRFHDLWLTIGGSAGHCGTWGLDIEETFDTHYESVQYELTLRKGSEIREEVRAATKSEQTSKADQKLARLEERMQRKASELIDQVYKGDRTLALTQSDIEGRISVSGSEIKRVMGIVLGDGRLKVMAKVIEKNGRKYDGYMLGDSLGCGSTWHG